MIGAQLPANFHVPLFHSSLGEDAVNLARLAGLELDEWQQHVVKASLNFDKWGSFTSKDVCLIVPRQNGKGGVLEARELAGLFLCGEKLIGHSAHETRTAREAYRRLAGLIQSVPELHEQVMAYRNSPSQTDIELFDGRRIIFATRTAGTFRGLIS